MARQEEWERRAFEKRQQRAEAIPREWVITPPQEDQANVLDVPETCGLLTQREIEITGTTDVSVVLSNLAAGFWSSLEVTTAFCKRAVIAQQLTNCLTEIFVDKALKRATELDQYYKENGKVIGPLHGLPVTLKDQFRVKGIDSTMGYVSWIGQSAEEDAPLVKILFNAGAIPYVKTNVPQTLMWGETFNNVFGRTLNPYNRKLMPGGSSGGEAALISLHGSVLGAGTDIGGSIRNPAHFCGIYGFKPSSHRIPIYGAANSLDGIKLFVKTILEGKPWRLDPNTMYKPWDDDVYALKYHNYGNRLCFGIMWDDGNYKPHPPIIRALQLAKAALEKAGHQVVDWVPFKHPELCANARSIFLSDGGADYQAALSSGEPLINSMKPDADPSDIPPFRRAREPLSTYQLWQLHKERRELRKAYFDRWEATISQTDTSRPVDAIICPVSPYAAVPHGEGRGAVYTIAWNALDCPSLVIPVTKVDASKDLKVPPHEFRNVDDEAIYNLYEPDLFDGMPVGLQIVGHKNEEESTIAIAEIVESALSSN